MSLSTECAAAFLSLRYPSLLSNCIFENGKVALNPRYRIYLNLVKGCMLLCLSKLDNKKLGSLRSFLSYKHLKLELRVSKASHIVAMVTCYIKRMNATCLPMIWHLYDTIIVASLVKQC